ncbi:DUF6445 family protein [Woodsholea maritima]|uniref:DUF6445 family protein n=1 Tax=Woodsholea maritima TaxID=240237 RepID=UPI000361ADF5|nr:DUF6445 family protein [Woodsholea maritima]
MSAAAGDIPVAERLSGLSPHPDLQVRIELMGQERLPVLILDPALHEIDALEAYACQDAVYAPVPAAGNAYPGVRAPMPRAYVAWIFHLLNPLFHQVFGFPAAAKVRVTGSDLSIVTTPPEDLSLAQRYPHFDTPDPQQLAILHYLRDEEFGGTSFYRHRQTGFERITPDRVGVYTQAMAQDLSQNGHAPARYVNGDMAEFERVGEVRARRNRLVVYPSNMLHSGSIPDDLPLVADPKKGRLTVNTFLRLQQGPIAS